MNEYEYEYDGISLLCTAMSDRERRKERGEQNREKRKGKR